jgi:hypothetical protein
MTVGQVINAGSEAINASGLNPWALNEGKALETDKISNWRTDLVIKCLEDETSDTGSKEIKNEQ